MVQSQDTQALFTSDPSWIDAGSESSLSRLLRFVHCLQQLLKQRLGEVRSCFRRFLCPVCPTMIAVMS